MNNLSYVGVDVSKAHLDAASDLATERLPNCPSAIAAWLKKLPPACHLIVEATGGYERPLVHACHRAGRSISVINPARVRHFARARGNLAKTDALDASCCANLAAPSSPRPIPRSPRPSASWPNSSRPATGSSICAPNSSTPWSMSNSPSCAEASSLNSRACNDASPAWKKLSGSPPSPTPNWPAAWLFLPPSPASPCSPPPPFLALLPELGCANRNQIAALAGLAPFNRDSGQKSGPRFTGHGRPRLRRALYLATLSAIRSPGDIADFYRRLRLSGKPAKLALIASARNLLCFLNSTLKASPS